MKTTVRGAWCVVVAMLIAQSAAAQRPTYQQQMQDNQSRLEGIRRERSQVEQELARLRTAAHSLSDELANIDRQKQSTNRIVNELDRQIAGLGGQIDQITVDLLLAQDALLEKRAVLERRIVDIHKRGPLYGWQVLLGFSLLNQVLNRLRLTFNVGAHAQKAAIAAEELGVNLILGGHYATETFGVKALATHLSERYGLPWEFIDSPTGL